MDKAEAFLQQARSDFRIFEELWKRDTSDIPVCHALQHLQMATEKLSKSALLSLGDERPDSHVAFRQLFQVIKRADVARRLGYTEDATQFKQLLDRRKEWFRDIERLSPSVGTNIEGGGSEGPNVEYPWEAKDELNNLTWYTPIEYQFAIARELRSRDGIEFIKLIQILLDRLPHAVTGR